MIRCSLALGLVVLSSSQVFAVSDAVKQACQDDYMSFCSQHEVGSQVLRSCMRANKKQLSKQCATTLARAGEATKSDIEQYKREVR